MTADRPTSLVVFGASGDLARRMLVPALFRLDEAGRLPDRLAIVGFARQPLTTEELRERVRPEDADGESWQRFADRLRYHRGDYADPRSYEALAARLDAEDEAAGAPAGTGNRLYYLATPPDVFPEIIRHAGALPHAGPGWRRIVVEKPFGRDLESARELNRRLLDHFSEEEVYRIDHYLGKETVQNILAFRLGNGLFEPLWNRGHIDHVQILVAEQLGVEERGGYYDRAGALRDMVQNHLLQLLCLVAMEPPGVFAADAVRNEKLKVLQCIRPFDPADLSARVVRGQYEGYTREPGVSPASTTETYAALRLEVDTWRWAGVPFFLRTGKALADRRTEVSIQFHHPPLALFSGVDGSHPIPPSVLTLRIQPDEGISLSLGLKPPGAGMRLEPVTLDFSYRQRFGGDPPAAYERLLLDAIHGDATLFLRGDEVEAAWAVVEPILRGWPEAPPPERYPRGSWGPRGADALVRPSGCAWQVPG